MANVRSAPNILITGTPGVGKSTLCEKIAAATGLKWIEISKVAHENGCIEEYDEVYSSGVLDDDKLLDLLEETMGYGGNIVDYHSCEFFPERWFDVVFVLRTNNTTLYDRLTTRGYSGKKLEDNVQCEIFNTISEEAVSSYSENIVFELSNGTLEDFEQNLQAVYAWLQQWFHNHSQ